MNIPYTNINKITKESVTKFFLDLDNLGLLYHIDDSPFDIWDDGERTFTDYECLVLQGILYHFGESMSWDDVWDCMPKIEDQEG